MPARLKFHNTRSGQLKISIPTLFWLKRKRIGQPGIGGKFNTHAPDAKFCFDQDGDTVLVIGYPKGHRVWIVENVTGRYHGFYFYTVEFAKIGFNRFAADKADL